MNKKLISIFALLLLPIAIYSQAPAIQWKKTFGGSILDFAKDVQQTSDGGYIVAGYSYSSDGDVIGNDGGIDCWIVKLNSNGVIQWQKSLGGTSPDYAYSIQQTTDGGYIIAGRSWSNDGDVNGNHGDSDYLVFKLNANGVIQWQKSLGGSDTDYANSIRQTTDGGYIIAGISNSNNFDVTENYAGYDFWIVKLNSNGTIDWQKSYGGGGEDWANSVQQTVDGGYIVAGYSNSNNGTVTGNHGDTDYWVIKLDNNGIVEWQKSLGGSNTDKANAIQQTADGGYIIAGESKSNNGDVSGNHGGTDCWIVKLNGNGNIEWQKTVGGSLNDSANSIKQTSDGGYIIAGNSESNNGDATQNFGKTDYWIFKLSQNGNLQWQKSLGGSDSETVAAAQQTSDGGYIVAGSSYSNNGDVAGNQRYSDYWVVKLGPDNLNTNEFTLKNTVLVENPAKDLLKIHSKDSITSLQLYSMGGRIIKTSNSKTMSVKELPKGIYILKIQLENGKTISEKIIKE